METDNKADSWWIDIQQSVNHFVNQPINQLKQKPPHPHWKQLFKKSTNAYPGTS